MRTMTSRLKLFLALALTLAVAAGTASSAEAGRKMEVAVQDDAALWQGIYSTPQIGIKLAQRLHTSRIRVTVSWNYVVGKKAAKKKKKPKHITYNWTGYDL